jgi:recombinational DNA repair protein (RecF pathway)
MSAQRLRAPQQQQQQQRRREIRAFFHEYFEINFNFSAPQQQPPQRRLPRK